LNLKNSILLLFTLLLACTLMSQNYTAVQFIENKGQWDKSIKYIGEVPAGAFYIQENGFSVLQHDPKGWEQSLEAAHGHYINDVSSISVKNPLRSHLYKVEFVGGNEHPQIIADKPLYTHNNYFIGNDPSKWASDCKIFQGVTVKDVYPNVDIRYYSNNGFVKYDLIVHPGADLSKIALHYIGADHLEVKNKALTIGTSVGDLKELPPFTYQYTENGRTEINSKYLLKDNTVRFDIRGYDPTSTLIIDPTLIFCTFAGSTTDNWGYTATYGPDGSMFGGGIVFGSGFPVSPGAVYSSNNGGSFDIGIIKLTPDGSNRVYATYLGGSGNERPTSLFVDGQGNLVVAGFSNSSDYPTKGAKQLGPGGGYDIIVTKLNANGSSLIGSLKIGGSGDDGLNISDYGGRPNSLQQNYGDFARSEVILDGANNIYVASCTRSSNFPVINSSIQPSSGGGQDAVVIKLLPDVSNALFTTYLGGSANDAAYVLSLNPLNNDIYVAGGTESTDFPGSHAGTVGPSYNGSVDGFIAVLTNNGSSVKRSTYIGTGSYDQIYGIQFDRFNFPYVMGQTTGNWPIINAAWNAGNSKQFIVKLQPDLSAYVYSTAFGADNGINAPNISPTAFLVDRCENVYVSGWGGGFGNGPANYEYPSDGTRNLPITSGALKNTTDGRDFYFIVLKKNASALLYGSFYGENNIPPNNTGSDHVDGGTSRFDKNGVIYQAICANCKSFGPVAFPTTAGSWSPTNPSTTGGQCNLALLKISFNLAGIHAGIQSSINGVVRDTAGCVPLTVDFKDTVLNAVSYEWNFGDGSGQFTSQAPNFSHTYNSTGVFKVMLVAIDSASCNIRDTSYMFIKVGATQALPNFTYTKLLPCTAFQYQFDNKTVEPAGHPFTNNSFIWDFGDGTPQVKAGLGQVSHTYNAPGSYNVKLYLVDTVYCNAPDSMVQTIRVSATVKAKFTTPLTGCSPYTAVFTNTSDGGQTFTWDFGDGSTLLNSANPTVTHFYANAGTYKITLTAVDSATCNITDSTSLTIVIMDKPKAAFSVAPQPPVENTPIQFTNLSSPDAVRFKWYFGDGDSLITDVRTPISHEYNSTGTFNAMLIAYNQNGCSDTARQQVVTLIKVALDVPNAFTPQSGDINSVVKVRGFGIGKMRFTIWNRWGQKVFETDDRHVGWDGKYKGVLQPMDVYAYTLEVEFTDGTKASKKGDITLIR
jgi:gliding motility-associated-like protein